MNKDNTRLTIYPLAKDTEPSTWIFLAKVHAGFPSPVEDAYRSQPIDLNKELIQNPAATYIVRVEGDSMVDEGVDSGDLLVVDRSIYPTEKNICVVMYDGEFALKRIVNRNGKVVLMAGNSRYKSIELDNPADLQLFGTVVWVMKKK